MRKVHGHKKRTAIPRRRQHTGQANVSALAIKNGIFVRIPEKFDTVSRNIVRGVTNRENVTEVQTRDEFTIHAASEGLCVTMRGCNGAELNKRRFQLDKHCPGWKLKKHKGGVIELLNIPNDFRPSWIVRERTLIASKQSGSSHHVTTPTPSLHNYREGKPNPDDRYAPPEFYGSHEPKRLNRGSKNGSRERQVNDRPTINEIDRKEAESDGIENYPMPLGGHLETARKLARAKKEESGILEDYHAKHLANIGQDYDD